MNENEITEMLKECQLQVRQEMHKIDERNNEKIEKLQDNVFEMEKRLVSLDTLIPMMRESLDGTTKSNQELSSTLITISDTIKSLSENQEKTSKQICSLSDKVDILEKQGTFNWMNFVQKNFINLIIILFLAVILIGMFFPQIKINMPMS